jgi:hypothetical protein
MGGRLAPAEAEALKLQAGPVELTRLEKEGDQAEGLEKKAEELGIRTRLRGFAASRDTHDLERRPSKARRSY